jgi:hypothetical protein
MKDKIDELTTNSKNKNIRDLYRGINEFKRGYQSIVHSRRRESHRKQMHVISPSLLELTHAAIT